MAFLSGYRVLDFADERGLLAGRVLADLGADVVHCEPPEGSRARRSAPRSPDGTSVFYSTFGANRRGVVLDASSAEGRHDLELLLEAADVVIECVGPEGSGSFGLEREAEMRKHPDLVWCSISAFGLDGPKANYAATDLTVWAAGGPLEAHRDGDRPPVRISVAQSFLHASADAAAGIVLALLARRDLRRGQHVDVSAQASLGIATLGQVLASVTEGAHPPATTTGPVGRGSRGDRRTKWDAKDGLIQFGFAIGPAAGRFTNALFGWMAEDGVDLGRFAEYDWTTVDRRMVDGEVTAADIEDARGLVSAFLAGKTKLEVTEQAVRRKVLPVGIFDVTDVARSPQLEARQFFVQLGEGRRSMRMPGPFAQIDQPAYAWRRPAPLVGEHTDEVIEEWGALESHRSPYRPARGEHRGPELTPALHGLRVVDVSWVVAGPTVGRALADFGATVVRVESSIRHDVARQLPPYIEGRVDPEGSALYGTCNAGKLGICLDLSTPEGRRVLGDLAEWADVLIESFSPGTMARWGLGPAELRQRNPRLVVLSTSLCGQSGPWSSLAGYGSVGAALAGFQNLVGWPDRPPLGPYGPYTDYVGPRFALVALLAALDWRRSSGEGCTIDVSQVEAGAWYLSPQLADWFTNAVVAERCGNDDPDFSPNGVYRCRDEPDGRERWVAISVRDEGEWRRLVGGMGATDLDVDALVGLESRRAARAEVDRAISAWCATQPARGVEQLLQQLGIPAHVAASSEDFCADPQLGHRGHLVRLPHPLYGEMVVEGPRWQLSLTPGGPRRHAPRFHEDTDQILFELLGYQATEVDALRAAGALS